MKILVIILLTFAYLAVAQNPQWPNQYISQTTAPDQSQINAWIDHVNYRVRVDGYQQNSNQRRYILVFVCPTDDCDWYVVDFEQVPVSCDKLLTFGKSAFWDHVYSGTSFPVRLLEAGVPSDFKQIDVHTWKKTYSGCRPGLLEFQQWELTDANLPKNFSFSVGVHDCNLYNGSQAFIFQSTVPPTNVFDSVIAQYCSK